MPGMVPKRVIEDIRFRTDIVDLVGSYVNLKRAGGTFKALCPFHKEKTPSFTVNPQRQIFHCFGCGVGGDAFAFMMKIEGVDFIGAIRLLAKRAGVAVEIEEGSGEAADKNLLYRIHEELALFYRRCLLQLPGARTAREYLAQRELSEETGEEFLIGFAPDRWDAVLRWAAKHKFTRDQLETCGLVIRSEKIPGKVRYYDRFRNRIMFPIRDEQNRVVGFSGRTLEQEARGGKYINSPETPLFRKSRILYALEKARRHIVDQREAILCEGQIDVIRCHQAGIPTAVASQGTAFTEDHARILQRYADSVTLVFDSDTAGQDAAIKASRTFMDAGLAVRVAQLPEGEDPDTFVRVHGAEAFRKVLDQATSVIRFQIDVLSAREDVKSEVGVMRAARAVLDTIGRSPNAVQRARLVQEAAQQLGLPVTALQDDLRHALRRGRGYPRRGGERPETGETGSGDASGEAAAEAEVIPLEERAVCEHLVQCDAATTDIVRRFLPLRLFRSPSCRQLATLCLEADHAGCELREVMNSGEEVTESFAEFAAAIQMAPARIKSKEFSHREAVQDLVLGIWRREMRAKQDALRPDQSGERSRITYELKAMRTWEDGSAIIELELEHQ